MGMRAARDSTIFKLIHKLYMKRQVWPIKWWIEQWSMSCVDSCFRAFFYEEETRKLTWKLLHSPPPVFSCSSPGDNEITPPCSLSLHHNKTHVQRVKADQDPLTHTIQDLHTYSLSLSQIKIHLKHIYYFSCYFPPFY